LTKRSWSCGGLFKTGMFVTSWSVDLLQIFIRTTGDADIWIEDTHANRSLFRKALKDAGFGDLPNLSPAGVPSDFSRVLNSIS
jgi:hypothetical protein